MLCTVIFVAGVNHPFLAGVNVDAAGKIIAATKSM
jgi:hypothetical protein